MGIFDFLKGRKSDDLIETEKVKRSRNPKANRIIKNDLERLNKVQSGLGSKAAAYVISGTNETVLSSISQATCADNIEIGKPWVRMNQTHARRNLFARMAPYDVALVSRYTEVLEACAPASPTDLSGSKKMNLALRLFFTESFKGVDKRPNYYGGPDKDKDYKSRVTPEIAIEICEAFDGSAVDYFDAVYNGPQNYYSSGSQNYRKVVELKPSIMAHPDAAVEAGKRVDANGREQLIKDLTKWNLLETSPFFEYVFDCISDSAKKVREAATASMKSVSAEKLEGLAITELSKGTVNKRAAMVDMLASIGTPTALEALKKHKSSEKAARVKAAIDIALAVEQRAAQQDSAPDDDRAYTAIDGSRVEIPEIKRLESGPFVQVTPEEKKDLENLVKKENERITKQIEENKRLGHRWKPAHLPLSATSTIIKHLRPVSKENINQYKYNFLFKGDGLKWLQAFLAKQAPATALEISLNKLNGIRTITYPYSDGMFKDRVTSYLESEQGDVRFLEQIDVLHGRVMHMGAWHNQKKRTMRKGDFLRLIISEGGYINNDPDDYPHHALWTYLAEHLDIFDEAFGLRPQQHSKLGRIEAIRMLTVLPKAPNRYFGTLLEAATGSTKGGRAEARAMLEGAEDVNERLITVLQDTRQAVRAGAADWMGERGHPDFIKPLKVRLKKEKSELAKASMLTALSRLGEDLSSFVGPKALIEEAEKNIKRAKFDKLAWLGLEHLPAVKFKSGKRVPDVVLKWWIYLAFKLKDPAGNKLFQLYLEQLEAKSGEAFSAWIFDSWVNYDTQKPSDADANKHAKQYAQGRYDSYKRWYKAYSVEQAFADLKREFMSNYLNSGAASKGILALAWLAPTQDTSTRVRQYLKAHGSRTSQASSLLSLLAAKADPVSLQVVISAATRLKQKGVQQFANTLLEKVAEDKGWTLDELADRTIPTAGFDDEGMLDLPCGPDEKLYRGVLTEDLKIELRNPDAKVIKGLASTPDDTTKASKKQLSASRKELKQVIAMQTTRLYEALCAERSWSVEDWKENFLEHPIMRKLIERVVWLGLDKDGKVIGAFRSTAEGDFTDAEDETVNLSKFASVRLAHGAAMSEAEAKSWQEHIEDYEITPLFIQFGRDLKRVDKDTKNNTVIEDKKGWVTDTFTVRGAASKLGYDRGEALDGGYFNEYTKSFRSAGIMAIIEFSGNCLPEENVAAALIQLQFHKLNARGGRGALLKLGEVPPVLLSECWNDYHAMAAKAAYDADWQKKMPWM